MNLLIVVTDAARALACQENTNMQSLLTTPLLTR